MGNGSERSLSMLAAAIEKEEQGKAFYEKSAATSTNELGRDIFSTLAVQEGVHIRRAKEIYDSLERGQGWTEQWKEHQQENEDLQALFRERINKHGKAAQAGSGDLEALGIGLEMEQEALNFYRKELEKAQDPVEKEFIERLIQEEHSHYESLADMKQYLTDPETWFVEHEKHTLDGA